MFRLKIHESYRNTVALCDADLLGKKFEEGVKQLHVRESFYDGGSFSEEEVIAQLKDQSLDDATFNIFGENSVRVAIKAGLIEEENIGSVQDVPFALVL